MTQVSKITIVWLLSFFTSIGIYFLTIVYLNEYINAATIDWEFLKRVGLIVLGSAGVLIAIEKIGNCIWPSYTDLVLSSTRPQAPVYYERGDIVALEIYRDEDPREKEGKRLLD